MLKVGPSWSTLGRAWDHKNKTDVAQIIVSRSEIGINFICFVYIEDGGNKLVMSEKIGDAEGGSVSLNTITLDYPNEVITGVTGKYQFLRYVGKYCRLSGFEGTRRLISSITIVTNKLKYGPVQVSPTEENVVVKEIEFEYYVGKQFGGFFGTFTSEGIETIGIYMKPLDKLPMNPIKKE